MPATEPPTDRRLPRARLAGLTRNVFGVVDFPGSARWSAASLINAAGSGLLLPVSLLYFTIHVGLSPSSVGLGLTIGGAIALAFVPLGGVLVDALGPKPVLLASWGLAAAAYAGYGAVTDWAELLIAVTAAEIAAAIGSTAGKALVTELVAGRDRVRMLASLQSLGNLGYGIGGLLATVALALGGDAYLFVVYGDALSFLIAIVLAAGLQVPARRVGRVEPAAGEGGMRQVLADRRYLVLAALDCLTTFQDGALSVALPLWVVLHTHAPRGLAGVLFTINTAVVVLFQVKVASGVRSVSDVPRTYRRAAVLMALCAGTYLAAHYVGGAVAIPVLVAALLLHTATEMFASAGEWTASVELAAEPHRGKYLAVYRLGFCVQDTLAPLVVTALLALGAVWLWPILAVLVCAGALGSAAVTARIPRPPSLRPSPTRSSAREVSRAAPALERGA